MATITLNYDAENTIAKKALDFLLSLDVFKVENSLTTRTFNKSIKELHSGKVTRLKNTKNPIAEILQ